MIDQLSSNPNMLLACWYLSAFFLGERQYFLCSCVIIVVWGHHHSKDWGHLWITFFSMYGWDLLSKTKEFVSKPKHFSLRSIWRSIIIILIIITIHQPCWYSQCVRLHLSLRVPLPVLFIPVCPTPGVVLLDVKEKTQASIMEKLVDEMANKKAIDPNNKDGILRALLQDRRYIIHWHWAGLNRLRAELVYLLAHGTLLSTIQLPSLSI